LLSVDFSHRIHEEKMDKEKSFMRGLCMGQIHEDLVIPFPEIKEAERETLESVTSSLGQMLSSHRQDFVEWDRAGECPPEFIEELKEFGLFSLIIPEESGGLGFGKAAYSRTLQEISKYDASAAVTVGAHSSIGMRGLLLFGTDEQKELYFEKLASGEMIAAFCLTEPGSGSDAASIKTRAVKDGDDWILNGEKIWITNGGMADFFTVFALTSGPDEKRKLSAFIVTRQMGGVSHGPHEDKMGLRASATNTMTFENVRVPKNHLLVDEGKGFKVAMNILNSGRSGLGGGAVGGMKNLIALSTKQANERVQFGRKISEFGLIKKKVGEMVVNCYAAESVVSLVAGLSDSGAEDYAIEAAISKVFSTEALWVAADEALQIAAGNGFMKEFPYEQIVRDVRINRIFEGTNDILRLFIALNGLDDVGHHLKELAKSVKGVFDDPIKGFGVMSDYALRRASFIAGISGDSGSFSGVAAELSKEQRIVEDGTRQLAAVADRLLRRHGKKIIERQFATARMADVMIHLYVLAAVLSRVTSSIQKKGAEGAKNEILIAQAFGTRTQRAVQHNVEEIDDNADSQIKALAVHAFELEKFGWDTI
jgi:alkylation response protein AidB-like acyl-CoA dehydrogenase